MNWLKEKLKENWKPWSEHPIYVLISTISLLILTTLAVLNYPPIDRYLFPNKAEDNKSACIGFQESGGTVAFEASKFVMQLPGVESANYNNIPNRNAVAIAWEENALYPDTLKAIPDFQETNTMSDTNGAALIYLINFSNPGIYHIYVRGFGINGNGDSIHVGLSGQPATTNLKNGFTLESDIQEPRWYWRSSQGTPVSIEVPNAGIYTFYVWMRENGVSIQRIWLDMIQGSVLNGDAKFGPVTSSCIETAPSQ